MDSLVSLEVNKVPISSIDEPSTKYEMCKDDDTVVSEDFKDLTEKKTKLEKLENETISGECTTESNQKRLNNVLQEEPKENKHLKKFKFKSKKMIDAKHPSDLSTPNIYSICFLQDGTLVLADFSNLRLKRVDRPGYSILDYCDIPGKPWQVCTISNNEVAVSCSDTVLHVVSLQPKMKKTRTIKLTHSCRGLAYANGNLYLSDSTSVYIYELKDNTLKQLFKIPLSPGISGLAVTNDGSSIYVADMEEGLLVLNRNRKKFITSKFDNNLLLGAKYVSVTENGKVLVAGNHTRNVLQLDPKSVLIRELLKIDKINVPVCIYHDHLSNKIIVSYTNQSKIEVYDLE